MRNVLTFLISILIAGVLQAQTGNIYTYPFTIGKVGVSNGQITLKGSTSGTAAIRVPVAAGTGTIFQLPANNGTSGYVLRTDGSGVLTWVAQVGGIAASDTAAMLAHYARLFSPTFTGVPAAPTATPATNTTQIATTAFVMANKGTGTVTSVVTGLGLSGGTITTTGTLAVDTAHAQILSRLRASHEYQVKGTYATGTGSASGTNTGDNAVNSNYSGLATSKLNAADSANGIGASGKWVTGKDYNTDMSGKQNRADTLTGAGHVATDHRVDVIEADLADYVLAVALGDSADGRGAANTYVTGKDFNTAIALKVDKATMPTTIGIACSDEATALTASTSVAKVTFRMPYAMTITDVRASVTTAPTDANILVDIHESGTTVLSTKIMIDATELTSTTRTTAYVIADAALADDASITVFVDQIGSTVAGAGLKIWVIGTRVAP